MSQYRVSRADLNLTSEALTEATSPLDPGPAFDVMAFAREGMIRMKDMEPLTEEKPTEPLTETVKPLKENTRRAKIRALRESIG